MRNLILISCLFLVFSGCNISLFHPYNKVKNDGVIHDLSSCFNNVDSSYLYQAEIRFMKNYYSGIIVFKPQNDSITRVVFMTEMGIKVFDFEIRNPLKYKDNYTVLYIMEPLSKNVIQKTLASDIGLLLQEGKHLPVKNYYDNKEQQIARIKNSGKRYFYFFNKGKEQYHQLKVNTRCLKKTKVEFYRNLNQQPDSVKINHYGLYLNYVFRRLKQ